MPNTVDKAMVGHVKAIVRVGQELKRWERRESELVHVVRNVEAATLHRGNGCSATPLCTRRDEVGRGGAPDTRAEVKEWLIDGQVELESMWRG
jgi:hypothetical protein